MSDLSDRGQEITYYANLLRTRSVELAALSNRLCNYSAETLEKRSQGIVPMVLPPSSDIVAIAGLVSMTAAKLSMVIELAYFESHPEERPY